MFTYVLISVVQLKRDGRFLMHFFFSFASVCRPSIDLAFAIDGCGRKPFHICIKFVKDVIRVSSFPKTNTRVGVIVYSRKARLLFSFNYFKNVDDLFSALDRLHFTSKQPGKPENIGAALSKAHDTLFSRSRGGVPKVLVVITGARANDDIINPSKRLRKEGVIIYGVGFGNDFEKSQLEIISSQPVHEHVFLAEPYLSNHITGVLRNHFCQGKRCRSLFLFRLIFFCKRIGKSWEILNDIISRRS